MPLEFTGGTSTPCSAWDNNVTVLNDALVDAEIVTNGLITLTKVDGSSFTNNIPYFPNFVVSGLALGVSNLFGFPNLVYNPGTYQIDAQVYTIGLGGNIILTPGHPTLPRVDIVYVTPSSTIVYLAGTPSLNPVQPAVPAGNLLVAVIGVSINATTIAGYTLTSVNFNNIALAPATINPGSTYGNTLYWNGSQWIETNQFNRVATGFSIDAYQHLVHDTTGVTTLAKFGESPSLGERGFEFQIINPTYNGILIFATEAGTTPSYSQYILRQENIASQYINTLDIDPTLNWSKIQSTGTNEFTEVYEDFNTVEISHYDLALNTINSQIKLLPTSIVDTVNGASGDIASNTLTATTNNILIQNSTGDFGLIQTQSDKARLEASNAALTETSEVLVLNTRTQILTEDTSSSEDSAINVRPYVIELESHSPGLDSSLTIEPAEINITTNITDLDSGLRFKQRNIAGSTAVAANDYILIATAAPITLTLPATPNNGQAYKVKSDGVATGGNPVTIDGNGKNIDAAATTIITTSYGSVNLTYNTALNKWLII